MTPSKMKIREPHCSILFRDLSCPSAAKSEPHDWPSKRLLSNKHLKIHDSDEQMTDLGRNPNGSFRLRFCEKRPFLGLPCAVTAGSRPGFPTRCAAARVRRMACRDHPLCRVSSLPMRHLDQGGRSGDGFSVPGQCNLCLQQLYLHLLRRQAAAREAEDLSRGSAVRR